MGARRSDDRNRQAISRGETAALLTFPPLIAAAAFLDDLVERRVPTWADAGLGIALGAVALVLVVVIARLRRRNADYARRAAAHEVMLEATRSLGDPERSVEALSRICDNACSILEVEQAAIFVRDEHDPDRYVALAGHGVPDDLIGAPLPGDAGMPGKVFASGQLVLVPDYQAFDRPMPHRVASRLHAGACAPIRWGGEVRGALSAGTTDSARSLGDRDGEVLERLAELAAIALEQALAREHRDRTLLGGAAGLAMAVDLRDSYTASHSEEVVELAELVGRWLGIEEVELRELKLAAKLHDIGKIGIPDDVLQKPGRLDEQEWELMRRHPVFGEQILRCIPGFERIASEHERWDGNGYPDGLTGERIPLASRIILACDSYHAMTSDRPYRKAMPAAEARAELEAHSGTQFDACVVTALLEALAEAPRPHPAAERDPRPAAASVGLGSPT